MKDVIKELERLEKEWEKAHKTSVEKELKNSKKGSVKK